MEGCTQHGDAERNDAKPLDFITEFDQLTMMKPNNVAESKFEKEIMEPWLPIVCGTTLVQMAEKELKFKI